MSIMLRLSQTGRRRPALWPLLALLLLGPSAGCELLRNRTTPSPIILSFSADALTLTAGQSTSLRWEVTGADSVAIRPGVGDVPLRGSAVVAPTATTTYTLTATSKAGVVDRVVVIVVR